MPRQTDIIIFDMATYEADLKRALKKTTIKVRDKMLAQVMVNLEGVQFKPNRVRMAGGDTTSDLERKAAVLNSIKIEQGFKYINDYVMSSAVSALKSNFEDSHIGIYYEYGTGVGVDNITPKGNMKKSSRGSIANEIFSDSTLWNPYRPHNAGSPIVTRARGTWTDLGGNERAGGSRNPGTRNTRFVKNVGNDIKATHWFYKAFVAMRKEAIKEYGKAIRYVNPLKYITVKSTYRLGGR